LSILPALLWPATAPARHEFTAVHMGLPVRVVLYAADASEARDAASAAFARIAALDAMMSDYRPDSELSTLNARAGEWVAVRLEMFDVVRRACDVARLTSGAYDPSVGPVVTLWRQSRRTKRFPSSEALAAARARVGWQRIDLDARRRAIRLAPGMRLDLGGIAKGYILQEALRALRQRGVDRALLEAGGDIVVGEAPPDLAGWRIESGAGRELRKRATRLTNAAVATSGPTAQFVEIDGLRYSHVIDPRTGFALTASRVAHVIAGDGATADALATAATVMGPDGIARLASAFPDAVVGFAR
jgi:thiamine biosynthesis lipoprotein